MLTGRLASSLQDANTQRQSVNAELHRRAFLDPLTDLPNRLLFEDRLQQALAKTKRGAKNHRRVAVLCVDLDGFKKTRSASPHPRSPKTCRTGCKTCGPRPSRIWIIAGVVQW